MGPYDEEMERYLKEFRPQPIRALEVAPLPRKTLWRRLTAAAAVAGCAGGLFWFARREFRLSKATGNVRAPNQSVINERQSRTIFALTALALADDKKFQAVLAEESRKSLPSFRGEQSTLKVLAKD
jgi:hypothetical protein